MTFLWLVWHNSAGDYAALRSVTVAARKLSHARKQVVERLSRRVRQRGRYHAISTARKLSHARKQVIDRLRYRRGSERILLSWAEVEGPEVVARAAEAARRSDQAASGHQLLRCGPGSGSPS
jgi:hypothetical protein